jgi:hypothetical protein
VGVRGRGFSEEGTDARPRDSVMGRNRIGSSMGYLKDSERTKLKGCTTRIRLGPTAMKIKI